MITRGISTILGYILLLHCAVGAPTEQKTWTSQEGKTLNAIAHGIESNEVIFETVSGKTARVPLERLSNEDQQFLSAHFTSNDPEKNVEATREERVQEAGRIIKDISAGEDSTILAYVPATADSAIKSPAICYIDQTPGQPKSLERLMAGADVIGWPVVMSSVVKGNLMKSAAGSIADGWVEAMKNYLPIDCDRLFGACYGSGADALMLMHKEMGKFNGIISFSGVLTGAGGSVPVSYCAVGINTPSRKSVSEGFDKKAPKGSLLRLTSERRKNGSTEDYEDAMVFLAASYYSDKGSLKSDEANGFTKRALVRVNDFGPSDPERAMLWLHWLESVRCTAELKERQVAATSTFRTDQTCRYLEGLAILQRFATNDLAKAGPSTDEESRAKLQKKIDRLTEQVEGTSWIQILAAFE